MRKIIGIIEVVVKYTKWPQEKLAAGLSRKKFVNILQQEDQKCEFFRIVRQGVRKNCDVI